MSKTTEDELHELLYVKNIVLLPDQIKALLDLIEAVATDHYWEGYEQAYG